MRIALYRLSAGRPASAYPQTIAALLQRGMIEVVHDRIRITPSGLAAITHPTKGTT
jgi:hypothetical protein